MGNELVLPINRDIFFDNNRYYLIINNFKGRLLSNIVMIVTCRNNFSYFTHI